VAVGDDDENEVQEIPRTMGRDKALGLKKKGVGSSGSSMNMNDETLARLMVSELATQTASAIAMKKDERAAYFEIKKREVELREREFELQAYRQRQEDMRFYMQPYDHLTRVQLAHMEAMRSEIKANQLYQMNHKTLIVPGTLEQINHNDDDDDDEAAVKMVTAVTTVAMAAVEAMMMEMMVASMMVRILQKSQEKCQNGKKMNTRRNEYTRARCLLAKVKPTSLHSSYMAIKILVQSSSSAKRNVIKANDWPHKAPRRWDCHAGNPCDSSHPRATNQVAMIG
ncbi:hypothetical protein Tco_0962059, partial [Tanacetum coccineum]